jgi:predicted aminopeptidase
VCGERKSRRKSNDIFAGSFQDTTLSYITCVLALITKGQTTVSNLAVLSDGHLSLLAFLKNLANGETSMPKFKILLEK